MTFITRSWLSALLVTPALGLVSLGDTPARAAGSAPGATATVTLLPHGITRSASGRYFEDVCDHDAPFYCMSKRMLPEDFRPEAYVRPEVGPGATPDGGGFDVGFCGKPSGPCTGPSCHKNPGAGAMAAGDVTAAYALPAAAKGNGKIIALIDMPDSHAFADVNVYRDQYGIKPLPLCKGDGGAGGLPGGEGTTPCFAQVDENGKPNSTTLDCPRGDSETALDMDMVSAACPDCSILLVQMTSAVPGPSDVDFVKAAKTAAALGASASSISFGGSESASDTTGYTTAGHLVLAASGDQGYLLGGSTPSYPGSAPDVLGVGGTILQASLSSDYSEVVWKDQNGAGGSGCSLKFPMPAYQSAFAAANGPGTLASCKARASVDLSAAADFEYNGSNTAISVYDNGTWGQFVGTSASAPMVAAILTRLNLTDPISKDFGYLYNHIGLFNDVTSGNNNASSSISCTDIMCNAGPCWDGPTGVGTPNGTMLAAATATPVPCVKPVIPDGGAEGGAQDAAAEVGMSSSSSGGGSGSSSGAQVMDASPVMDGSMDGGNGDSGGGSSGCGCVVLGSSGTSGTLSILALGGLATLLVRRRRR